MDMDQLVDSMSSITFDQTTLNAASDCVTNSQDNAASDVAVFQPVALQHFCDPFPACTGHLGSREETAGPIMALSQTPMTLASTAGLSFSQPAPAFQPSLPDDSVEQYGCLDLQDMLISDDNINMWS